MADTINFKHNSILYKVPLRSVLEENFERSYSCYYQVNPKSPFGALCDNYGSDKGEVAPDGHPYPWRSHTYADFIDRHFGHCRDYIQNVFEMGIGTTNTDIPANMGPKGKPGASLRVWRDYFPYASIVGADIDEDILFQEDRISTHQCDQTDPRSIAALWAQVDAAPFDLMIDDGLHTFEAGATFFEHAFDRLKSGGLYIIEDVSIETMIKFKRYFRDTDFIYDFVNLYRGDDAPLSDNSLVVIRKP